MSHFTVLVTKTNKTPLDEQLAPFDENTEVPQYIKHTKEQLIAKERAEFEEYRDTTYAKFLANPEAYKASTTNEAHIKYLENEFPKRLDWTDEDFYQYAIRYDKDNLTPGGGVYSTYNPRSKWDWYEVGGRWAGYFKVKPGATGETGEHAAKRFASITGEHVDDLPSDVADIAKVKDIDWQTMKDEKRAEAEKNWAEYEAKKATGEKIDPYWDYDIEKDETREAYIQRQSSIATFAVLHDGEWYEKGEMGWWAMVSNEKSQADWQTQFDKIIKSLDPEDEVTVVDAHI